MKEIKRNSDLLKLIRLDPHELTISLIKELITSKLVNGEVVEPKYNLSDFFLLKKNDCCNNTKDVITSIGILIMNKWFIEPYLSDLIKYQNKRFDKKMFKILDNIVSSNFLNGKLEFEAYEYHLNASQTQGQLGEIVSPSYSTGTLTLPPKSAKLKKDLIKENKKALDNGNVTVSNMIRDKVIDSVKEELKDDPGLDNYTSGSKASFNSTYAVMNIMQGAVEKSDGDGYKIITNSYDEGIKKEDYVALANSAVTGIKSRALDVAVGGTIQRKIMSMTQESVFAGENTDCGTEKTISIVLRKPSDYLYRNIKVGDKVVNLTPDIIKKYEGKTVNMYSPIFCKSPEPTFCEKCTGRHPAIMDIKKIGLLAQGAGSALLNSNLKAFHDSSVVTNKIDPKKLLLDE